MLANANNPQISLLDSILTTYQADLGHDFPAYKNHCYRVYHFCLALIESHAFLDQKLVIAVIGRPEWTAEIDAMIQEHHKITAVTGKPLVEAFRKADWIDVSLGLINFGLDKEWINTVRNAFPDEGFHKRLIQLTGNRFLSNPLSPLPMVKW